MLVRAGTYEDVCQAFRWTVPERFNIAEAACDRHVGAHREALVCEDADGRVERYSFEALKDLSSRLANALAAKGVERGDRVAILLPQSVETAIAHLAAYRMGAIALPLFVQFGPEALEYRLSNSGARVVVTNDAGLLRLIEIRDHLPELRVIVNTEQSRGGGALGYQELVAAAAPAHVMIDTAAEDPAIMLYTSGTTGPPKGVLHAHRVLIGHLPGVELANEFFPQPGDRMWTPADWAWIGGLLDVLLPSLFHGVSVVACRFPKFDPEKAFALLARHEVRNAFIPPTALKMMRQAAASRTAGGTVRTIVSGGERLGDELHEWGLRTFGVTINEFYGQTEANLLVGNCAALMPTRPGSMGRAVPGHRVEVLDEEGRIARPGEVGTIAVQAPDPVMFLNYWRNPDATRQKFRGPWCMTGDRARRDDQGYLWFDGRDDDVINTSGYRVGPAEIEDCLMRHPAVALVAVVGVPDQLRGEIVKAFIVPRPEASPGPDLAADIQAFVKTRLSAHEYPRLVEFRDTLPMTVTGKIRRRDLREQQPMS
jgi:acetyl-CoA synthetase